MDDAPYPELAPAALDREAVRTGPVYPTAVLEPLPPMTWRGEDERRGAGEEPEARVRLLPAPAVTIRQVTTTLSVTSTTVTITPPDAGTGSIPRVAARLPVPALEPWVQDILGGATVDDALNGLFEDVDLFLLRQFGSVPA
jgi:hypothetical protein